MAKKSSSSNENNKPKKLKIKELSKSLFDVNNENCWLAQSTVMTLMQYNYTLLQSKIFLGIVDKLQVAIKDCLSDFSKRKAEINDCSTPIQKSFFDYKEFYNPDSQESIRISFKISDFGVEKNQYSQLKEALRTISNVPVKIPRKINGRDYEEYDNLCSTIVPKDIRSDGDIVYVVIKKSTAERMLCISSGYTLYLKQTILQSKTSYTPRFYMILSLYKGFTYKKIQMKYIRELLCLEDKYKVFRDFKDRVLDTACNDLKRMANEGIANFYFEWEKWYEPTRARKAGEPDAIIFKFYTTESILSGGTTELLNKRKDNIYNLLRSEHINMNEQMASKIRDYVTLENFNLIQEKISFTFDYIRKHPDIKFKTDYMFKAIINELYSYNYIDKSPENIIDVDYEEFSQTKKELT